MLTRWEADGEGDDCERRNIEKHKRVYVVTNQTRQKVSVGHLCLIQNRCNTSPIKVMCKRLISGSFRVALEVKTRHYTSDVYTLAPVVVGPSVSSVDYRTHALSGDGIEPPLHHESVNPSYRVPGLRSTDPLISPVVYVSGSSHSTPTCTKHPCLLTTTTSDLGVPSTHPTIPLPPLRPPDSNVPPTTN